MKRSIIFLLLLSFSYVYAQTESGMSSAEEFEPVPKETNKLWSINLIFSDNGFGGGATYYHDLNKNTQLFGSLLFSMGKDDREFENYDIYGNSYIPGKVNRIFMIPMNIGIQYRLFREEVSDEMRPFVNGGIVPTMFLYTPYSQSFFPSFGSARTKYTVGAFAGVGVDYVTSETSSLSMNVRYYYLKLFGEGIESLEGKPKDFFGGLHFTFSYNFMR